MSQKEYTGTVGKMKTENKWLASEDFSGMEEVKLTIEAVYANSAEIMQGGKKKDFYSVAFANTPKHLVLNATNRKALAFAFGASVMEWKGKDVYIWAQEGVQAIGGGTTVGLRLRPADPTARPKAIGNPFAKKDEPLILESTTDDDPTLPVVGSSEEETE